jgi:hypothetical protein
MRLSAALFAARTAGQAPPPGDADTLANPEPGFHVLGEKSYGRHPGFLLQAGYAQVAAVLDALAARAGTTAAG